ncbi:DUF7405 family protein [Natronobacterium texcoconense]|uniref:Deferrochelatase/peroxidase EfeB n=1 Tax=Natronobacterium texcoconense TaxID=1095778 RepID=A0A1H1IWR7_NATTX|nr:Tat pathway signal protein [Natronobacterium texcoconense]SDR42155.1 hypothetical protein SAMN04489842_3866 [Natronobacterium texcoconense]
MTLPDRSTLPRRDYLRTLVAVGGAGALAACLETVRNDAERTIPAGTDDPDSLPERQHAWNDALPTDDHGNVIPPEHHVLVAVSLADDVDPAGDASKPRETVESALRTLERAYEWSNEGLLFTLGYTPAYFARFDESLPESVDLPDPEPLIRGGNPEFDEYDAVLHLASDEPDVVLEVEEALFGDRETVNGVDLERDLTEVFEPLEDHRRTGFVGEGLPAEHTDVPGVPDSIPEEAPFFMGFRSGFRRSQATEDRVTIESGPFAGGTTQQLSSMDLQLEVWFEQDNHFQRVSKLFSREHAEEELVGDYGEALADSSGLTDERIESTTADARQYGVVGHAQKTARARVDGEPPLLRRDFNTVDGDRPGLHFLSLQRDIDDFVRVREAMNGENLDVPSANNGILHYVFVDRRGNYLLPPRSLRALPTPDPDADSE